MRGCFHLSADFIARRMHTIERYVSLHKALLLQLESFPIMSF